jgi:hypothetical protein
VIDVCYLCIYYYNRCNGDDVKDFGPYRILFMIVCALCINWIYSMGLSSKALWDEVRREGELE